MNGTLSSISTGIIANLITPLLERIALAPPESKAARVLGAVVGFGDYRRKFLATTSRSLEKALQSSDGFFQTLNDSVKAEIIYTLWHRHVAGDPFGAELADTIAETCATGMSPDFKKKTQSERSEFAQSLLKLFSEEAHTCFPEAAQLIKSAEILDRIAQQGNEIRDGFARFSNQLKSQKWRLLERKSTEELKRLCLQKRIEPGDMLPVEMIARIIEHFERGLPEHLPKPKNPAGFLRAQYEMVPFIWEARQTERDFLTDWCGDPEPIKIKLFTGPGGSGKTRMFLEWCHELNQSPDEWKALFLSEGLPLGKVPLSERVFLVVDYAEVRTSLSQELEKLVAHGHSLGITLRIALLAREASDWWKGLIEKDSGFREFLDPEPQPLAIVESNSLRQHVFEEAVFAFADQVDGPKIPNEMPALHDPVYDRFLYLHMAALLHVMGEKVKPEDLVERILQHEEAYWVKAMGIQNDRERRLFLPKAKRLVAALTLRGNTQFEDANSLAIRWGIQEAFCLTVQDLYPSNRPDSGLSITGLDPDLIGEALVFNTLVNDRNWPAYLDQVFENEDESGILYGFTVLGRISINHRLECEPWVSHLLKSDVSNRILPALFAALSLGEKSAFAALGTFLAKTLEAQGTPEIAAMIEPLLPEYTVSLREVKKWATETRLTHLPDDDEEENQNERARLLNNLGAMHGDLGLREAALAATQEAVTHFRALAEARPDAFLPDLAGSLNNLGTLHADLGEREAALSNTLEAASIFTALAEANPDAFLPDLAMSLQNLGTKYANLGQREAALDAAQKAVSLYRVLAKARPDTFLPNLASSLNNQGLRHADLGQSEAALSASQEAVSLSRIFAERHPDAFLPDLARSLQILGSIYGKLGQREAALDATQEAFTLYSALADANFEAFLPDLANSLNDLGNRYSDLGQYEYGLLATQNAVSHYRVLAEALPDAFLPDLAMGLLNHGHMHSDLNQHEAALTVTQEAVTHYRTLTEALPDAFLPDLAMSLNNLGTMHRDLGQREAALAVTQEAVTHYRALAEALPDAFLSDLAMSLNNLGASHEDLGELDTALATTQEAVTLRRALAKARPDAFLPDLAMSLNNLGNMHSGLGQREAALAAATEAVSIYQRLFEALPQAFIANFSHSIQTLAEILQEAELFPEENPTFVSAITALQTFLPESPTEEP